MAHFIIFIFQTLQVWEIFSRKHRANTEQTPSKQQDADVYYYKSKTIRDRNTKLTEDDNELWPSMSLKFVIHIFISTGVIRGTTYPPPA